MTSSRMNAQMPGDKLRMLYVGFNRLYLNPTNDIYLSILGQLATLEFFGPGFSGKNDLEKGIDHWLKSKDAYDFIIFDSFLLECTAILRRKNPFGHSVILFNKTDYERYSRDLREWCIDTKHRKIFLANMDPYCVSEELIDDLISSQCHLLEGYSCTMRPIAEIKAYYMAHSHLGNNVPRIYQMANDNWYNFTAKNPERVICLPHVVGDNEFRRQALELRETNFRVIGVGYPERRHASRHEPTMGAFWRRGRTALSYFFTTKIWRPNSGRYIMQQRARYSDEIMSSQMCYASGSPVMCAVRKYFEIPAHGAVSVGWPLFNMKSLGFIDKKNFLIARNHTELSTVLKHRDAFKLQKIADRGQRMIWNNHSQWARREQLTRAITSIYQGRYCGADWVDGSFVVRSVKRLSRDDPKNQENTIKT